jgi:uncharacterized protein YigA (DUF484 family)
MKLPFITQRKTITSVLKQFNDAIDSLDEIATENDNERNRIAGQISQLQGDLHVAESVRDHANRVAAKMRDIFHTVG